MQHGEFSGSRPSGNLREEINDEHRMLRQKLSAVANLCPHTLSGSNCTGCPDHSSKHCCRIVSDLSEDLISYMVSHFRNEERMMRETGLFQRARETCERHMQDHGDMSEAALQLVTHLDECKLATQITGLTDFLERWMSDHIVQHDRPMLDMLDES